MNAPLHVALVRWLARLWAGASAFVILLFFLDGVGAEGIGALFRLPAAQSAMLVAFAAMWVGLALGWHHELAGGLLTVGGLGAFYLTDLLSSGDMPTGPWFLIFAAPGFLYLYCAWATSAGHRPLAT